MKCILSLLLLQISLDSCLSSSSDSPSSIREIAKSIRRLSEKGKSVSADDHPFALSFPSVPVANFSLNQFTERDPHVAEHRCIHDEMMRRHGNPSLRGTVWAGRESDLLPIGSKRDLSGKTLRIFLHTDNLVPGKDQYACSVAGKTVTNAGKSFTCRDSDVLTQAKADWLTKSLLPVAESILESTLYVDRVPGNLKLENGRTDCGFDEKVTIPTEYISPNEGIPNADLVIFVTARPIASDGVLAFGGECQSMLPNHRAIAGQLNYSPASLTVGKKYQSQVGTTLHEISHVLGFSNSKFSNFYDAATNSTKDVSSVKATVDLGWKTTEMIKTDNVKAFVARHFGCSTLEGGELEDGGGDGTRLSHWEKRVYFNEYMTGSASSDPIFSELTWAMFKDSGWYTDYDMFGCEKLNLENTTVCDPLVFGHGLGCNFAKGKCNSDSPSAASGWPKKDRIPGYFCDTSLETSCTFDMRAKARCGIESWSPAMDAKYTIFPGSPKGGLSSLADYCPYYSGYEYCTDTSNFGSNGEEYCPTCRCFENTLVDISAAFGGDTNLKQMGCYKSVCTNNSTMLIGIDDTYYKCDPGQDVSADGKAGTITCPNSAQITSICGSYEGHAQSFEPDWHSIVSISPDSGHPEDETTITGTNFGNNISDLQVDIHGPCTILEVTNETLKVRLPNSDSFKSPTNIFEQKVAVKVKKVSNGKTIGLANAYAVSVEFNLDFFANAFQYLVENPLYGAMVLGFILLAILCCVYCCCGGKKKNSKKDESYGESNLYR